MSWDALDKVPSHIEQLCEPVKCYRLDDVRAVATEWVELDQGNNWLAVVLDESHVGYGLYRFVVSEGGGKNVMVTRVFAGSGTRGLREMRHTWWAPDEQDPDMRGYTYYLPLAATIKALQHLQRYFD